LIRDPEAVKLLSMEINQFNVGKVYNRSDLISAFGGSFMRGMNVCNKTGTLVLISKHTRNRIYGDAFKNDLMIYTGEGQRGDQSLSGGNRKLYYSEIEKTPVHLFVVFNKSEYTYYGLVKLIDNIYYEDEIDVDGTLRKVIRFPLTRLSGAAIPMSAQEQEVKIVGGIGPFVKPTYNVVGAAIIKEGRVLCAQRGHGALKGKWEFPGGKIEDGESLSEALKREIKEELNIDISIDKIIDENSHEYPDFRINLTVYKCNYIGGKIKNTEHQELRWVADHEIGSLDWADADRPIVDTFIESLPANITSEVSFNYFESKPVEPSDSDTRRALQDYEASQKKKTASGKEAELSVIRYERDKLNNIGRPDLADKIIQKSEESSDDGYDILSYEVKNDVVHEIHIEVKSAKLTSGYIEFFISANELRKFKKDNFFKVYCLFKNGRAYKLHEVNKTNFFSNNYLSPLTYRVRIRITE
jgi:8-oxo-dGTP diphosphatase